MAKGVGKGGPMGEEWRGVDGVRKEREGRRMGGKGGKAEIKRRGEGNMQGGLAPWAQGDRCPWEVASILQGGGGRP